MEEYTFKEIESAHRSALRQFVREYWGGDMMVSRGKIHYPAEQDGFWAERAGFPAGLLTYDVRDSDMEITLLQSRDRELGIGSRLVELALEKARAMGCSRVWLVMTNDNIRAFRFYQKRGFGLVRLHFDAVRESRRLKPQIPEFGQEGIPIRHELELEWRLEGRQR